MLSFLIRKISDFLLPIGYPIFKDICSKEIMLEYEQEQIPKKKTDSYQVPYLESDTDSEPDTFHASIPASVPASVPASFPDLIPKSGKKYICKSKQKKDLCGPYGDLGVGVYYIPNGSSIVMQFKEKNIDGEYVEIIFF
jgi:hypothetical protein